MSENPSWMEKVEKMAQEVAEREGCVLYDIDFIGAGTGRTLRIFIDKEAGVGINECSDVSKGINLLLDVDDAIPGEAYNLEVSTPGVERQLRKPWHFEKAVGRKIFVKTSKPLETAGVTDKKWKAAKTIEAVLESADAEGISFKINGADFKVPYAIIEKAKIMFELTKGQKK